MIYETDVILLYRQETYLILEGSCIILKNSQDVLYKMTIKINTQKFFNLSPPSLLAIGFLSFIIIGTLLLKLPIANKGNLSWMDALFTATSAVTITGLSVVNLK